MLPQKHKPSKCGLVFPNCGHLSVHKLVVCALSVGRLWSDARVFDRPARHPLSERSFFLPSFFLSCFSCGVPFARACLVVLLRVRSERFVVCRVLCTFPGSRFAT